MLSVFSTIVVYLLVLSLLVIVLPVLQFTDSGYQLTFQIHRILILF